MPGSEYRASDADRDRVAEVLREAHAQGRIDLDELGERLDATYAARTYADLEALTRDLPPGRDLRVPGEPPPAPWPAPQRGAPPRGKPPGGVPAPWTPSGPPGARSEQGLRAAWAAWTVAVSVNVVIWLLVSISSGDALYFWPMWVAGPWGAVLLAVTVVNRRRG
jgi:hypothetical protein